MSPTARLQLIVGLAAALLSQAASATLITVAPSGGSTVTMPGGGSSCSGASTATVGGFLMTSTNDWCHDYSAIFAFGPDSGNWVDFGLVGDNSGVSAITIDLGGLYSTVGGFMNYSPGFGTPTITAIAADGTTVLETYDLSVAAPISTAFDSVNDGAFRGIQRPSADIRFLQIGGSFLATHDLTLVPEPGTGLLVVGGAIGIATSRRSRSSR